MFSVLFILNFILILYYRSGTGLKNILLYMYCTFKSVLFLRDNYVTAIQCTFIILEYDETDDVYSKLICVITGRGPLKYHYQQIILKLKWKKVSIITPWLENKDYPLLLGKTDGFLK